jgi:hypothetical protein
MSFVCERTYCLNHRFANGRLLDVRTAHQVELEVGGGGTAHARQPVPEPCEITAAPCHLIAEGARTDTLSPSAARSAWHS